MLKRFVIFLLILNTVNAASVESTVVTNYIQKYQPIEINWTLSEINGTDVLRFYLLPCDIGTTGIKCASIKADKKVRETAVYNETPIGNASVVTEAGFGLYRLCVNLLHGGQDCDKDNYFLVREELEKVSVFERIIEKEIIIEKVEYVTPKPSFILTVNKLPEKFEAGKNITTMINLTNPTNFSQFARVYSYIFNSSKVYTGSWTSNEVQVELPAFSSVNMELINNIEKDAKGNLTFRIRAKVNGTNYDTSNKIFVEEYLFTNVTIVSNFSNELHVNFANKGNMPANVSLIIYDSNATRKSIIISPNEELNFTYNVSKNKVLFQVFEEEKLIHSNLIDNYEAPEIVGMSVVNNQNVLYSIFSLFSLVALYLVTRRYS